MSKDLIDLIEGISSILAIITWLSVFLYFILIGFDAMLIRMTIIGTILSIIYTYFIKKKHND